MRLRNVLIVVNDMDRAIRFYKEIFGLQVILDQDGNVIMSEGLVLQDAKIWQRFLDKELIPKNNMTELYFEEPDIEGFVKKLEGSDFEIEYVNELMEHSWGARSPVDFGLARTEAERRQIRIYLLLLSILQMKINWKRYLRIRR